MQKQVSVNEFVLQLDEGHPQLLGGACRNCGNVTFPKLAGCPKCNGTDIVVKPLSGDGKLWGWTVQGFPPKSPPYLGANEAHNFTPFGVGYVELDEVIVEARLTESEPAELHEGLPMTLTVEPLFEDDEGNQVVTFAFKPSNQSSG